MHPREKHKTEPEFATSFTHLPTCLEGLVVSFHVEALIIESLQSASDEIELLATGGACCDLPQIRLGVGDIFRGLVKVSAVYSHVR